MDLVAWLMIPCTLALTLSSTNITRLLYEAGRFKAIDTTATAIAIEAYSYGLLGYGLLKVMNSYYYATGRTRFPMVISLISIAGNYIANSLLVQEFGHKGLAVTASIMLSFNSLMLIAGMVRDKVHVNWKQVFSSTALLFFASVVTIVAHHIYNPAISAFSVGPIFGIQSGTALLKIDSTIRLSVDSIVIIGLFGTVGLARIKKTPKDALRMLKRRKN
jgi:putative peptidoglycan lipid II flippase